MSAPSVRGVIEYGVVWDDKVVLSFGSGVPAREKAETFMTEEKERYLSRHKATTPTLRLQARTVYLTAWREVTAQEEDLDVLAILKV